MSSTIFELGTDGPSRILVGVDGTPTSLRAAAYAVGMARRHGSRLIVVYVASTAAVGMQTAITAGAMVQTQEELGEELRQRFTEGARELNLEVEFVVRRGNPYRELVAVAAERRVDAMVVGASTSAGRRFVGSLAGRLVRDATWPITVVP